MDEFHDKVAGQIDKRKLEKLVASGQISEDDLRDAPIYELTQTCKCLSAEPSENNRCIQCGAEYTSERVG